MTSSPPTPPSRTRVVATPSDWAGLILGLVLVFVLFHASALRLGSDRGQAGVLVGALVAFATIAVERVRSPRSLRATLHDLGLGRPAPRGLVPALAAGTLLVLVVPSWLGIGSLVAYPGAVGFVPGLLAQAGVAEELLFRGYLYGQVRRGRSFWRAASLAMPPFVAVHLLMFTTMAWPVALASLALAVVVSFPLSRLFDLGGGTIWAPAMLHFVIQGALKVIVVPDDQTVVFPLVWMAACALIPLLVFLVPAGRSSV